MNALLLQFGIGWLKPFATALLLPPVPFVLSSVLGLAFLRRRRRLGVALIGFGVATSWLSGCVAMAQVAAPLLLSMSPVLDAQRIAALRSGGSGGAAIVVLGGGVEERAPEYGSSSLRYPSLERLRFGLWLGRRTRWPVGFSGGIGWGQPDKGSAREADVAQMIATTEFGQPLRWVESASRDTRENAQLTAALLKPLAIHHVLLVTHAWHMQRAKRNFELAFGHDVIIEPAPMGMAAETEWPLLEWVPSGEGLVQLRSVVREYIGLLAGA